MLFAVNGSGDVVNFVVTGDWLRNASGVVISQGALPWGRRAYHAV
jgi:hypothetical protein